MPAFFRRVDGVRVAVTGSHGFIGSALVESLERDDHDVVRVGRDDIDAGALEGVEAVVHLAGEPIAARRWSAEQKRKILDSRTATTAELADDVGRHGRPAHGPRLRFGRRVLRRPR